MVDLATNKYGVDVVISLENDKISEPSFERLDESKLFLSLDFCFERLDESKLFLSLDFLEFSPFNSFIKSSIFETSSVVPGFVVSVVPGLLIFFSASFEKSDIKSFVEDCNEAILSSWSDICFVNNSLVSRYL